MNDSVLEDQLTYWTLSLKEEVRKSTEDIIQDQHNPRRLTSGQDRYKKTKQTNPLAEESRKYPASNKSKNRTQIQCPGISTNKTGIFRSLLNKFHSKETAKKSNISPGKNSSEKSTENRTTYKSSENRGAKEAKISKDKIQNQYHHPISNSQNKCKEFSDFISMIEGYDTCPTSSKSEKCTQPDSANTEKAEDSNENAKHLEKLLLEDSSGTAIKQFSAPVFFTCQSYKSIEKDLLPSKSDLSSYSGQTLDAQSESEMVKNSGDDSGGVFIDGNYTKCSTNFCSTGAVKEKDNNEMPKTEDEFRVEQQCKEVEETDSIRLIASECSSCCLSSPENSFGDEKKLLIGNNKEEKDEAQITGLEKRNRPSGLNVRVKQPIAVPLTREELSESLTTETMEHLNQKLSVTEISNSVLKETESNVEVGLHDARLYGDVIHTGLKQEQNKTGNCGDDSASEL